MNLSKNKHVLTAAIVAPILALMAYYGIDLLVGEKPHAAMPGQSYALVEKPNCRRGGGECGLENGEFKLDLQVEWMSEDRIVLRLESAFPLDGVMVALADPGMDEGTPTDMQAESDDGRSWALAVSAVDADMERIRLVASANEAVYYSDGSTRFFQR